MEQDSIAHRFFESQLFCSLRSKLILSFLAISMIPLAVVVTLAYLQFQEALRSQTSNQLIIVRDLKAKQVQSYLRQIAQDIKLVADLPYVKTGIQQLEIGVGGQGLNQVRQMGFLGHPDLFYLKAYHPYAVYHAKYHAFFHELVQTKGYADIWLVSPKGDIIYTYAKRNDFATNLLQGPYQGTLPAQLFQSLLANPKAGQEQMTDFGAYSPAENTPVSFIGVPIVDEDKILGCLIYQLSLDPINDLMIVHTGLWKTSETYLVGADYLARTKTLFTKQIHFFEQKVDTLAVKKGLMGESGVATIEDYRGIPVLSAYQPIAMDRFKWVLLAEVDQAEAFGPSNRLRNLMVSIVFVTTLLVISIGFYIGRSITKPIVELAETSTRIASGDLELRARSRTRDEIGHLADAFNRMTGRLSELIGSLEQQIAEREQAEEKLKTSEERLRMTLEATQIGIWDWDVVNDRYFASPTYYSMLGYEPREGLADRSMWVQRLHPDDKKMVLEEVQNVLSGTCDEYSYEARLRHADGSYKWQWAFGYGAEYDQNGKVARMLGLRIDIDKRKQMEQELAAYREHLEELVRERTEELEAANKELEAFAYSVSHDLRAPLRHIDGFLELLRKKIGTALDGQNRQYMTAISEAAIKMGLLVDDLLSFSRMGRQDLSVQPVDLGSLVGDVIREIEPDAQGRSIDWRIGDLPMVNGDAAMLRMVLGNLIANAVKFTRPREKARIEIGSLPGKDAATVIFVRDNGVGFDMAYADKLFGVFQRLHRAEEFEGTGIGLANVHRIISRHGGRTWAKGAVDQGATFYFALPHTKQGGSDGRP